MKQQKRKGFTLVELLVVIAILAILATVSIVGYTSFVKKANISNDTALAKQINDLLLADETVDGKPGTLGGALAVVAENGFDVTKLTPTAQGHEFVYDVANNRFALMNGEKVVYSASNLSSGADLWKFVNNEEGKDYSETSENSIYFQNSVGNVTLTKLVGVEVAEGCEIASLTITDNAFDKTAVIAGKIGTLTITAEKATIHHYNEVGSVNIIKVAPQSYHEFGVVTGNITLTSGRVVMEQGSSAAAIDIKATAESINNDSAVISVDNTAAPETVIMIAEDVKTAIESKGGDNKLDIAAESVIAYGTKAVAAVGTKTYNSFEGISMWDMNNALYRWNSKGGTLRLLSDITVTSGIDARKTCTLDLNGHKLNLGSNFITVAKSGNLTIIDSAQTGESGLTGNSAIISNNGGIVTIESGRMVSSSTNAGTIQHVNGTTIINGGEIVSENYIGVMVWYTGTITINGGTIKGVASIQTHGNEKTNARTININGGNINGMIYKPDGGTLNITGGNFTGDTCVYAKSGMTNITGGTFTATGEKMSYNHNGSGAAATGDAIVIEACSYPGGNPSTQIVKNATITSKNGEAIACFVLYEEGKDPYISIDSDVEYSMYSATKQADGSYEIVKTN